MELDILERVTKDREEIESQATTKEALVSKIVSVETSSELDKEKYPKGEIPQISVEKQVKDYLQTSNLNIITSALDTQEFVTSQSAEIS